MVCRFYSAHHNGWPDRILLSNFCMVVETYRGGVARTCTSSNLTAFHSRPKGEFYALYHNIHALAQILILIPYIEVVAFEMKPAIVPTKRYISNPKKLQIFDWKCKSEGWIRTNGFALFIFTKPHLIRHTV